MRPYLDPLGKRIGPGGGKKNIRDPCAPKERGQERAFGA